MVTSVFAVVVSSLLIRSALSAETSWGRCPVPPAMYGFEMSKFEGLWYLQETFDPGERCATWNVTKGRESNTWKVVESKESGAFSAMGFRHADFHTGTITMLDAKNQGDLRVFWPISALGGDSSLIVYDTDYDNYAGVFECQNLGFFHRRNGIILARKPVMDNMYRGRARLYSDVIKADHYQRVRQGGSNCMYKYKYIPRNETNGNHYDEYSGDYYYNDSWEYEAAH